MAKENFRCTPCDYEYEHLYFDTVPRDMQKPVPPCPICTKELTPVEWDVHDDYSYYCESKTGGCGLIASVEYLKGTAPATRECFQCHKTMKLGAKFGAPGISHNGTTTKGASLDVVIGRDANQRWEGIYDRTDKRNKLRKEAGTNALTMTGYNEFKPIQGAKLQAVSTKGTDRI